MRWESEFGINWNMALKTSKNTICIMTDTASSDGPKEHAYRRKAAWAKLPTAALVIVMAW